jgi:hypothetical protein
MPVLVLAFGTLGALICLTVLSVASVSWAQQWIASYGLFTVTVTSAAGLVGSSLIAAMGCAILDSMRKS